MLDERISVMYYTLTMAYYKPYKRNESLILAATWVYLKNIYQVNEASLKSHMLCDTSFRKWQLHRQRMQVGKVARA